MLPVQPLAPPPLLRSSHPDPSILISPNSTSDQQKKFFWQECRGMLFNKNPFLPTNSQIMSNQGDVWCRSAVCSLFQPLNILRHHSQPQNPLQRLSNPTSTFQKSPLHSSRILPGQNVRQKMSDPKSGSCCMTNEIDPCCCGMYKRKL